MFASGNVVPSGRLGPTTPRRFAALEHFYVLEPVDAAALT